jgi:hypothetical protein
VKIIIQETTSNGRLVMVDLLTIEGNPPEGGILNWGALKAQLEAKYPNRGVRTNLVEADIAYLVLESTPPVPQPDFSPHKFYLEFNGNYYSQFIKNNPEFNTERFQEYVITNNKGDRDSGELEHIAKHEVLRLAYEYEENRFRWPNVYKATV